VALADEVQEVASITWAKVESNLAICLLNSGRPLAVIESFHEQDNLLCIRGLWILVNNFKGSEGQRLDKEVLINQVSP